MTPFVLTKVEELVDGRVYCEWETVADDGLFLREGDYFTPEPGESVAACVRRRVLGVQANRDRINAAPKVQPRREPARKRTTATLSEQDVNALVGELSRSVGPVVN